MKEIQVREASASDEAIWNAYVQTSKDATFYHQWAWKKLVETTYSLSTHYLLATISEQVTGVLPMIGIRSITGPPALVSLPFGNYGGILANDADAEKALVDSALGIIAQNKWGYAELKHVQAHLSPSFTNKLDYHRLVLSLEGGSEYVWSEKFSGKVRNQCRKANKSGLTSKVGHKGWNDFVNVYRRNLRDLGTPSHSTRWFQGILDLFGDAVTTVVTYFNGKPISGVMLFFYKDVAIVQYGASIRHYLKYCPNHASYWQAIQFCCEQGYRSFDFARSRIGGGTYHFKTQWGAVPHPIFHQYLSRMPGEVPDIDPSNPKYALFIKLWKRMPLCLSNRLGHYLRTRLTT